MLTNLFAFLGSKTPKDVTRKFTKGDVKYVATVRDKKYFVCSVALVLQTQETPKDAGRIYATLTKKSGKPCVEITKISMGKVSTVRIRKLLVAEVMGFARSGNVQLPVLANLTTLKLMENELTQIGFLLMENSGRYMIKRQ